MYYIFNFSINIKVFFKNEVYINQKKLLKTESQVKAHGISMWKTDERGEEEDRGPQCPTL